jgi:hypothetical protein
MTNELTTNHVAAYSVSTTLRDVVDMTVYTASCSCGWLVQFEGGLHRGKPVPPAGWDGRAHAVAHLERARTEILTRDWPAVSL